MKEAMILAAMSQEVRDKWQKGLDDNVAKLAQEYNCSIEQIQVQIDIGTKLGDPPNYKLMIPS